MTGLRRLRAAATVVLAGAVAGAVATTAWAAPVTPMPVKDAPAVLETAPAAAGPWFGWAQSPRGRASQPSFFVERGDRPRVRVNAAGTTSSGGGILDRVVIYAQQRGSTKPQLFSYDLRTGRRAALPPAVNQATYRGQRTTIRGDVSASGSRVLFTRRAASAGGDATDQVILYDRVTRRLRVLDSVLTDTSGVRAGQVDGSWATYARTIVGGANTSEVVRVNLRTGGRTTIGASNDPDGDRAPMAVHDPAVGPDGTLYYWRFTQTSSGGPITGAHDLVRVPVGGPREVVASVTSGLEGPTRTSVDERAGGATRVYYELDGDIFRVDD